GRSWGAGRPPGRRGAPARDCGPPPAATRRRAPPRPPFRSCRWLRSRSARAEERSGGRRVRPGLCRRARRQRPSPPAEREHPDDPSKHRRRHISSPPFPFLAQTNLRLRLDVAHPVGALALGNKVEAPAMLGEPDLDFARLTGDAASSGQVEVKGARPESAESLVSRGEGCLAALLAGAHAGEAARPNFRISPS